MYSGVRTSIQRFVSQQKRKDYCMKKRIVSLLLATLLTLCFALPAAAAETDNISVTVDGYGRITSVTVTGTNVNITLPTSKDNRQITGVAPNCSFSGSIGTLTVPSGLSLTSYSLSNCTARTINLGSRSTIPESLFAGNSYVTTIAIPSSVYSIGAGAFSGCTSLTGAALPEEITVIPDSCFSGCTSITAIDIPKNVTSIGDYAFSGCSRLQSVDFSSALKIIGENAFADCTSLKNITTDETATFPSVVTIGSKAFYSTAITNLFLPDTVTTLGVSSFEKCKQLTELYIGSGITIIPSMCFTGCTNLYKLSLGDKVKSIEQEAFCYSFNHDRYNAEIILPSSLSYIGSKAFEGCGYIEYIAVHNASCQIASDAFYRSGSFVMKGYDGSTAEQFCKTASYITFKSLTGGSDDESGYEDLRYTVENNEISITAYVGSGEDTVTVPSTINGKKVTVIDANAFMRSDVVNVILPASIHTIRERAFANCTRLTSILILDNCRTIESSAFTGASSSLTIRGLKSSYAQAFASAQKINFSAVSNDEYKCLVGTHGTTREERKEATCKEEGYERTVCTVCGQTIKETVLAKPTSHKYVETVVEPTCTEKGYTLHTCEYCKDSYKDKEKNALGHQWEDWQVILKPTYTTNGTRTRHCLNKGCNETEVDTIPMLTVLSFDELISAMPTDDYYVVEKEDGNETVKLFCGFTEKTDVSIAAELFDSQYKVKLITAKGSEKKSGYIATGDKFVLNDAQGNIVDSLTVVVLGDMTGDGKVNAADYIAQRRVILGIMDPTADKYVAGDINDNGKIQPNDYIKLRRYILGMITTLK